MLERLLETKKPLEIILPSRKQVRDYFGKVRLLDALKSLTALEGTPESLESIFARLTPILPVRSFSTGNEVEEIANQIFEAMGHAGGLTSLIDPCYTVVSELASNVVQHSEAKRGWVLAQRYNYSSGRVIEIAVGDSGIGIRRSLRKNPNLRARITGDVIAVRESVKESISRFSDPHRGYGLYYVGAEMRFPDRRFMIRSGVGCSVVYDNGR
ncbi:MAG: hypothetical protein HY666_06240 [Chloroflexi bacterium]|nr:hypothetical protein [Chloroflexota bacterium]